VADVGAAGDGSANRAPALGQMAEDVLDHDHGGIDDQAEIDRADRQQVRRLAAHHHDQDGEEQGERDRRRDDDRAAQIAQEQPLHEEDQDHALDHVVQHGVGGDAIRSVRS
jgi:hypothetical protein